MFYNAAGDGTEARPRRMIPACRPDHRHVVVVGELYDHVGGRAHLGEKRWFDPFRTQNLVRVIQNRPGFRGNSTSVIFPSRAALRSLSSAAT
jgi:hypothetical protein